jgi:hypothetical protein
LRPAVRTRIQRTVPGVMPLITAVPPWKMPTVVRFASEAEVRE